MRRTTPHESTTAGDEDGMSPQQDHEQEQDERHNHEQQVGAAPCAPDPAYRVGYGRPPLATRFQPGHSGNPRGRPKKSRNLRTIVTEALAEPVTVREGERVRKVTKAEAMVQAMLMRGMKGDARAFAALMALALRTGQLEPAAEDTGSEDALAPDDAAIIAGYMARMGQEGSR